MAKEELALLFRYNRWANRRVLSACRALPAAQLFTAAPVSFGNLMGTLAHIYGAEVTWRLRLQDGQSPQRLPTDRDFLSLPELEAQWRMEEAAMQRFLDSLSEDDLHRVVDYATLSGTPQRNVLWQALTHVVFHGTQFRSEAGAALAHSGHSPGDLDLILYLRETEPL
jgi:uncharacterized damage-inducible protein DinB